MRSRADTKISPNFFQGYPKTGDLYSVYNLVGWLTDKTPDDHATASWNSIVKKSRGCFWCWIFEAMAGAGSAFAERCTLVRSSYPLLRASFTQFQPIFR